MAPRRYPYIWTNSRRPPWRAARWAALLTAGAILLFLFLGGASIEIDPMLRELLSVIGRIFS
jgi:hypothetical protein